MARDDGSETGAPGSSSGEGGTSRGKGGTGGDVRCKLLRADGSEWTVTDLGLESDGLHVSAYRYVREGHTAAEARRETLLDELLSPDDRVWCLNRRGAVIWDLSHPDAGALPRAEDGPVDVG